jgi:hypothetical protein
MRCGIVIGVLREIRTKYATLSTPVCFLLNCGPKVPVNDE